MNCKQLEHLIKEEARLIPEFINTKYSKHKERYEYIRAIVYLYSLCIDDKFIDYMDLIEYDESIKDLIELLEDSCDNDKEMMSTIWQHIVTLYECYLKTCEDFELYESASNLQKIKSLYSGF